LWLLGRDLLIDVCLDVRSGGQRFACRDIVPRWRLLAVTLFPLTLHSRCLSRTGSLREARSHAICAQDRERKLILCHCAHHAYWTHPSFCSESSFLTVANHSFFSRACRSRIEDPRIKQLMSSNPQIHGRNNLTRICHTHIPHFLHTPINQASNVLTRQHRLSHIRPHY
jgi:hypothetical protein